MKKILNKKVLGVLLAVMMLFSLAAPAFATGTTATVKVYVPDYFYDFVIDDNIETDHVGYSYAGTRADAYTEEDVDVYSYTCTPVDYSTITNWLVTVPATIADWHPLYNYSGTYIPTAFDVIYKSIVTGKGESTDVYPSLNGNFVYGFESPTGYWNGVDFVRADGIFIRQVSDTEEYYIDTDYETYWMGYNWNIYAVPSSAANTFDPLAPDATYLISLYPNNVPAQNGYTYYLIYEYAEEFDF